MAFAIKCWGFAAGAYCPVAGQYLKSYDPNAPEERGLMEWTRDLRDAKAFPTAMAVMEEWKLVRTVDPHGGRVEPDGKLNRPLTAYNIELVKIPGTHEFLNPADLDGPQPGTVK